MLVRGLRVVTDKVEEAWESTFVDEGMRETLTEIQRLDSSFDVDKFTLHCERVIFPAVLEAELSGDLSVLKVCPQPGHSSTSALHAVASHV